MTELISTATLTISMPYEKATPIMGVISTAKPLLITLPLRNELLTWISSFRRDTIAYAAEIHCFHFNQLWLVSCKNTCYSKKFFSISLFSFCHSPVNIRASVCGIERKRVRISLVVSSDRHESERENQQKNEKNCLFLFKHLTSHKFNCLIDSRLIVLICDIIRLYFSWCTQRW